MYISVLLLESMGFDEDRYVWNITGSSYNWDVIKGCTPSNLTGPCGDHNYLRNNGRFHFEALAINGDYDSDSDKGFNTVKEW